MSGKAIPLLWAGDNKSLNYCAGGGNEKEAEDVRNITKLLHKAKLN